MKLSCHWLKEYISLNIKPDILAQKLTMAGLEVKGTEVLSDGDTVFEIEVTPNRPDCLNVLGLAREAAAIFNKSLKLPITKQIHRPKTKADIAIADSKDCARYIGTVIKDVKVGESPGWLKTRVSSVGIRSINNVVDITNFCLFEIGQPLHAFDLDKLSGGKIIVRRAKEGEKIVTIDGIERKLDPTILVIADEKKPVAIAGIMGGKDTEVTASTKNILLESAYFDPILIRRACRKLGLTSDSSYRFERNVHMDGVEAGSTRATGLIQIYAKGAIHSFLDLYSGKTTKRKKTITIAKEDIDRLLGFEVPGWRIKSILEKLEFDVKATKKSLSLTVPTFRGDISQDVDIVEEVARIIGYDAVSMTTPVIKASNIPENPMRLFRKRLADLLVGQGLSEIISYTMTHAKDLERSSVMAKDVLRVQNALTLDQEMMRPSLLPSMMSVVSGNFNKGQKDLALFELGKIYSAKDEVEKEILGVILTGRRHTDWRKPSKDEVDFYDLKGIVDELMDHLGLQSVRFERSAEPYFYCDKSASIIMGQDTIGQFGVLSESVVDHWDIKYKNVIYGELDAALLLKNVQVTKRFETICEYPIIIRDVSLAVEASMTFEKIRSLAFETAGKYLKSVKFIEQYVGEKIPAGFRAMTISLSYQAKDKTLREDEVNGLQDSFVKALQERFAAVIR